MSGKLALIIFIYIHYYVPVLTVRISFNVLQPKKLDMHESMGGVALRYTMYSDFVLGQTFDLLDICFDS